MQGRGKIRGEYEMCVVYLLPQDTWERASKMAQWVKVLAAKPKYLSSIPETHMMKGKNQGIQIVLWLP